jgi:hypothetical protein
VGERVLEERHAFAVGRDAQVAGPERLAEHSADRELDLGRGALAPNDREL